MYLHTGGKQLAVERQTDVAHGGYPRQIQDDAHCEVGEVGPVAGPEPRHRDGQPGHGGEHEEEAASDQGPDPEVNILLKIQMKNRLFELIKK